MSSALKASIAAAEMAPNNNAPMARVLTHAAPTVDPLGYMAIADQVILLGTGVICYAMLAHSVHLPLSMIGAMAVGSIMFALSAYSRNLYSYFRMENVIRQFMPFGFACFQFMMAVSAALFLMPPFAFAKPWALSWFVISALTMAVLRGNFWFSLEHLLRLGVYARKIILVGTSEKAGPMMQHFMQHEGLYHIVGLFVMDAANPGTHTPSHIPHPARIPELSSFDALTRLCRDAQVDDVIITPELEHHPEAEKVLKTLEALPCSIKYCIPGSFFNRPLARVELISHIPVVTIFQRPLRGTALIIKRGEDIILSSLALCLAIPVMLVIALFVALDGQGHILFRQKRHGFGGREFDIYKFRSMRVHQASEHEVVQAARDDMRVTWIGKILRRTSMDELPQLFNVLKGDMSLVGPRPHAVVHNYHYKELINGYVARQRIKPGMTGWAQINGWRGKRTLEKMRKRVEHDLYYVENWSLWFDIKIIILTLVTLFRQPNAY